MWMANGWDSALDWTNGQLTLGEQKEGWKNLSLLGNTANNTTNQLSLPAQQLDPATAKLLSTQPYQPGGAYAGGPVSEDGTSLASMLQDLGPQYHMRAYDGTGMPIGATGQYPNTGVLGF